MNAYELADELQELDSKLHLINLFKSANMLRQQAQEKATLSDRIAELEKDLLRFMKHYNEMAWKLEEVGGAYQIPKEPDFWTDGKYYCNKEKSTLCTIPLYTTPQTKPLSDEEILKQWTWKYTTCYEDNLLKFARAIETKVRGEK